MLLPAPRACAIEAVAFSITGLLNGLIEPLRDVSFDAVGEYDSDDDEAATGEGVGTLLVVSASPGTSFDCGVVSPAAGFRPLEDGRWELESAEQNFSLGGMPGTYT